METHKAPGFQLGISEDRNKRCRRTMEDAHTFVFDYMGIPRQGFFAIFDGHAGKATAEWCGENFDKVKNKRTSLCEILILYLLGVGKSD